jgi:hypothetical protein
VFIFSFFSFLCHRLPYLCHNSLFKNYIIHFIFFYVALKKNS